MMKKLLIGFVVAILVYIWFSKFHWAGRLIDASTPSQEQRLDLVNLRVVSTSCAEDTRKFCARTGASTYDWLDCLKNNEDQLIGKCKDDLQVVEDYRVKRQYAN